MALAYGPTSKICRTPIGWNPLQHGKRLQMLIRQFTVASLFSLAVISPGSTQAAKPPFLSARPTPKESAPALLLVMAK